MLTPAIFSSHILRISVFFCFFFLHGDVVCTSGLSSEHGAPFTPLLHWRGAQHSSDSLIEYRFQAPLGECRAL